MTLAIFDAEPASGSIEPYGRAMVEMRDGQGDLQRTFTLDLEKTEHRTSRVYTDLHSRVS